MKAEAAKENFEVEAKNFREEAELARKAKEAALEERVEATKKHEVLSIYFNFIRLHCFLYKRLR